MKQLFFLSIYLFFMGLLGLLSFNKHLLSMLLYMEFMVLGLLWLVALQLMNLFLTWMILLLAFFLVCESIIGISCVILLARSQGDELIVNMTLIKC